MILNGVIEGDVLPSGMKVVVAIQLLKGGSASTVKHYYPISLLPCMSHILERHLFTVMTNFLHKARLLSLCHYEFIAGLGAKVLLEGFAGSL